MRLVTDQVTQAEVQVMLRELSKLIKEGVSGDVVELGCYEGGSAVELQRYLQKHSPERMLWLYDSFEGLPEKTKEDESPSGQQFRAGELKAAVSRLKRNFVKQSLPLPEIKRAWFFELDPEDLPDHIAFAFLDGDYYESIKDSLRLVWPKLSSGGRIVIDDYTNPALPGVALAVNEFAQVRDLVIRTEQGLALITL